MSDILSLADFVETDPEPKWFKFINPETDEETTFEVLLAFIPPDENTNLVLRSRKVEKSETGKSVEVFDATKHAVSLANKSIKDWRGLSVDVLRILFPGARIKVDASNEIEGMRATKANRELLVRKSRIFAAWIAGLVDDWEKFNAEKKDEELKN